MKKSSSSSAGGSHLRALFRCLEQQHGLLRAAGASKELIEHYSELLNYLNSLSEQDRKSIFPTSSERPSDSFLQSNLPGDDSIKQWSLDQVEAFLVETEVSRKDMERVARIRFSLPNSSITNQKNRESLKKKLEVLVKNERGHESIRRLADARSDSKVDQQSTLDLPARRVR